MKSTGDVIKRPQLAKTLKVLQTEPDAIYSGSLADGLIKEIKKYKGIITKEDLNNYK